MRICDFGAVGLYEGSEEGEGSEAADVYVRV